MPTASLSFTDRFRFPLVRVAGRLQQRDSKKARILAAFILSELEAAAADGCAVAQEHGDSRLVECHDRHIRATPEVISFMATLARVLSLSGFIHKSLAEDPELADLLPLLKVLPRPKLDRR